MIRIGILGTASIARLFFGEPLRHARIVGIASRDVARAGEFAKHYGIPRVYPSYDALLTDDAIDAVYIPLPPHLHCAYTVKAAEAGKHVLVEKPAAPSTAEIEQMTSACCRHKVVLMEGFMYRFKAIHHRVRGLVQEGALGTIRYLDFSWAFNIRKLTRSPFRLDRMAGGGALNDLGIYGIDFLRFLGLPEPALIHATTEHDGPAGVDMFTHMTWQAGPTFASITCGFTCDANYYTVCGELGSVTVPGSLSGRIRDNVLHLHLLHSDHRADETFPAENPYVKELDHFAVCCATGHEPETGGENALRNMRLIEAVRERVRRL
jgi:D-xylose 1-dehydrogenase (NADP+, D-xylono-1,5-lactone-forming)